jgi:hypothetical protein
MKKLANFTFGLVGVACMLTIAHVTGSAQKLEKPLYIQATAMGQGTQMGQSYNVTLIVNELSPPDDQKVLVDAFNAKKNEGLVNALTKMGSKGRMMITGTVGYDVNYIRAFPQSDGSTKYRLVTDRPIAFGEAWTDSRSMDYSLSGIEVVINSDKKKNSGVMYPASELKIDKEGQLQLDLRMNPWKLVNVMLR